MEIEVKLKYKNKNGIVLLLKKNKFRLIGKKEIKDFYYMPGSTFSNNNAFYRIRNIKGVLTELTLKDKFKDKGGIWTKREINIGIDDFNNMETVLSSLGCNLIKEHFSKREIWRNNKVSVEFINFLSPAKLSLIEIEGPSKESISNLIKLLGNKVEIVGEDFFSVFDKEAKNASSI